MDYDLEKLGDDRFQKLCQAILSATFPHIQCLPINQPDGGRDAFARAAPGYSIFQVKFSRDPASKDERAAVAALITTEKAKVEKLIARGATSYYLLTNVSGTAHLDVGSIDKVNDELTAAFGIPSFCWWRDDLERRIEGIDGLIWRYPDMFRGSDFLEILSSGRSLPLSKAKTNAFRAYVADQYAKESEVKFQQVQIQNSLLDLFTDTPVGITREKVPDLVECKVDERLVSYLANSAARHRY